MPNHIREVLFNDGEALDFGDLNNVQRYLRCQAWDEMFALQIKIAGAFFFEERWGALPDAGHCYAMGGGQISGGGSARQLVSFAGLIGQCTASFGGQPNGTDAQFLAYYLTDNEINVTTAIGDATNPRIDIVCVKLSYESADVTDDESRDFQDATTLAPSSQTFVKKRKVKMQSQLVAGTPGVTPAEPAVPSGYVKLAAVTVPATHNTTHDWLTNGRDYRMPIRPVRQNVYAFGNGPGVNVESGWATAITSGGLQSSAGSQVVRIFPPAHAFYNARLLGVSIIGDLTTGGAATVEIIRRFHAATAGGDTDTVLATATAGNPISGYNASATEAFWLNGRRGGVDLEGNSGTALQETLGLKVTSAAANQIIRYVVWKFAAS